MKTTEKPRRVLLGQIASVHGIRGDVVVRSYTADPAAIASYGPLSDTAGKRCFDLKIVRVTDKGVVARIDGVSDRTAAEALRGTDLYVERTKLPAEAESEFYYTDLIGLEARAADGDVIGHVVAVHNFGAGDLIEIKPNVGGPTELVSFEDEFVPQVDVEAGFVVIVRPVYGDASPDDDA